jgi:hypothetical protein
MFRLGDIIELDNCFWSYGDKSMLNNDLVIKDKLGSGGYGSVYDLEDEREGAEHELYYSRRPLTPQAKEQYENRLKEINKEVDKINKNSNLKSDLKSTMSTARLASLPSFQERNSQNVDKVLSDTNLLKHITSFNTNLGGRKHTKKHRKRSKQNKKGRKTKSKKRHQTKKYKK